MFHVLKKSCPGKDILRESVKEKIENALIIFPFWPHDYSETAKDLSCVEYTLKLKNDFVRNDQIKFWSENHALMLLSSAHLFR